ncbi:polysaccharide deacetylase family protein [Dyadobacter fanqingshengii]|uniref:Polysaccharide deacetylase family protein n=1 Tax=Dyadobacter fanqingshengii TaxID=2906443 RepID=A0A9X1TB82_9BACT|nr:polysaccharide deacetylase family protein [Dyadobacter fanqingshengii]MCF0042318.1 polysaccharide deacetylase family protein [Dyadobacter fanqingshengii]USJ35154.1 polysaccharide deacetylase family protein [Dyadobacter fanqingshengii]
MKYSAATFLRHCLVKCIFLCVGIGIIQCRSDSQTHEKAGIAISFDDHFINEWFALRPLFKKYNAKVTFFVTCPDSLTQDEISKLRTLQSEGHEIGFHGTIHGKSTELIAAGPEKYKEIELTPGLLNMANAGFKPTSYAHPGGDHNNQVDSVLLASGFKILRDVAISRRKIMGFQMYALAPRLMPWIYYSFDQEHIVDALLIDEDTGLTEPEMIEALEKAKSDNKALMLFGHEPLYGKPQNGEYGFSVPFLEKILKEADRQQLKFYTMSELPEIK